jgi:glycine/D-amino acid oxidase-like deaminating enzyme
MTDRALEYMPGLARLSALRTWTGFRAATSDKLPLIGPLPGYRNIYLATGHEGLGITTSLGTARILVDQVTGRASAIPRESYLPLRMSTGESDA